MLDEDLCYRAVSGRDARFDGSFITAVTSTSIYCRPSCPAVTPKRANVRFYRTAAAAQGAGFRACKRCRPDASPGSPEWNLRADLVGRAMRLIGDGVVEREGVNGLASRLGYSVRQLHRQLVSELGAGPQAIARAQRAQTARILLETTQLRAAEVAFTAGFGSIRQFNDTVREVFDAAPLALRDAASGRPHDAVPVPGKIVLRLPYRPPYDSRAVFAFLAARAVPGIEEYADDTYRRTLSLPGGPGVVELSEGPGYLCATLRLSDLSDLSAAVHRCRRLLDLDADPLAVADQLGCDPVLAPLVAAHPGRRMPGSADAEETAVRAVLGQQISVTAARTLAGRLVAAYGEPLPSPDGGLRSLFPTPARLAELDPAALPMPVARARAVVGLAGALAGGGLTLHDGVDRDEAEHQLLALPGIGPWSAGYVRMRGLADPDVALPTDLGVRRALARLGANAGASGRGQAWRPWRSYAVAHLWALDAPRSASDHPDDSDHPEHPDHPDDRGTSR